MLHDEDSNDMADVLPDCVLRRALDIAQAKEERDGGTIIEEALQHFFPDVSHEERVELIHEVFHAGAHHAMESVRTLLEGRDVRSMSACFPLSVAFAEGMLVASEAQRLYEQETRDAISEIPTTKES